MREHLEGAAGHGLLAERSGQQRRLVQFLGGCNAVLGRRERSVTVCASVAGGMEEEQKSEENDYDCDCR